MRRNVAKNIREYQTKVKAGTWRDVFEFRDIKALEEVSMDSNGNLYAIELAYNALMLGYVVGRRAAIREMKKTAQAAGK